ncbi:MAG: J domain-containing protein [Desulfobulbaceae bacterium]|nr:J domain-containing protein [Desulfobulbaceae bacterium]
MALVLAENKLFHACRVLFGSELAITRDFLEYLQSSGLKTAYRKRALETHPDRVAALGIDDQGHDSDLFRQVQSAYENLSTYLDAREKGVILMPTATAPNFRGQGFAHPPTNGGHAWQQGNRRTDSASDFRKKWQAGQQQRSNNGRPCADNPQWNIDSRFEGNLPNRELRLGHFLYYAGLISWRQIIQALVWQRTQRPRLGELGRRYGWLNDADVLAVLQARRPPQLFGQTAVSLGLFTEKQLQTLIWRQKFLQRKIGQFFVEEAILPLEELQKLIRLHQEHNSKVSRSGRFSSYRF